MQESLIAEYQLSNEDAEQRKKRHLKYKRKLWVDK